MIHVIEGVTIEPKLPFLIIYAVIVPDPSSLVIDSGWVLCLRRNYIKLASDIGPTLFSWQADYFDSLLGHSSCIVLFEMFEHHTIVN